MNRSVVALHYYAPPKPETEILSLLNHRIEIRHIGCDEDIGAMAAHIRDYDGKVDAIAVVGVARTLRLGMAQVDHEEAAHIFEAAAETPVVDGQGLLGAVERWGTSLADEKEPGLWTRKQVLMVPGLNHDGLVDGLSHFTAEIRYADPIIYFALPSAPGIGSKESLGAVAERTLAQLQGFSFGALFPRAGEPGRPRSDRLFDWADVLAGDIGAIRRYSPQDLSGKTIVTTAVGAADVADLTARGASILVTLLPNLSHDERLFAHHGPAELEACLVALRPDPAQPLAEHTYLNLLTGLAWRPAVRYLQPDEARLNRFAFVAQPLSHNLLRRLYRWTQYVPEGMLRRSAPFVPPVFLGRLRQISSPATGTTAEGILLLLGGTPDAYSERSAPLVLRRLQQAAAMAERLDARLLGVSTYSAIMGQAAEQVSHKTDIAITSGRSLTLAAALEAAKSAVQVLGHGLSLAETEVVILHATLPDAETCARYLARHCPCITLVGTRPEHLFGLKKQIEAESPDARVTISTSASEALHRAHLLVTTVASEARMPGPTLDLGQILPGTVVCDFGRPPLVPAALAEKRPDLVLIHDAELRLPGSPVSDVELGHHAGLVPAALAETALLALEGRFEDFSLNTVPDVDRLWEIIALAQRHQFIIAGARSFDNLLTRDRLVAVRDRATALHRDPARQAQILAASRGRPEENLPVEEGLRDTDGRVLLAALGAFALLAGAVGWLLTRKKRQ